MNNLINSIINKINYVIEQSNKSFDSINEKTSQINYNDGEIKSINSNNKEIIENKDLVKPNDESITNKQNNAIINRPNKVWYTHYRGYIVKSILDIETGEIYEKMIPYNQPSNFRKFLDNYFENELN